MGAGKSTTLKKIMLDNAIRGNFIRTLDVTGEFEEMVRALGGKIIRLDGTEGIINPLQVLKTDENPHKSFMQHLSKLSMFYRFLTPQATDEDIKEFEKVLRNLYIDRVFFKGERVVDSSELEPTDYPIFSDLLAHVQKELYENETIKKALAPSRALRLEKIELTIENICDNYGYLFNAHSTIADITEEPVISFSLRSLTSMKQEVFNAQMFNILSLLWDNLLKTGYSQWKGHNSGDILFEDATRYMIVIDEAHRIINAKNPLAVQFITDFSREARRYFGGLIFASQSIRDFVPDGSSLDVISQIKTLFELTQYKFIMQQDSNSLQVLRQVFEGQLSESELERIPFLGQGECILSITSVGNIAFQVEASKEELTMFGGGA